MRKKLIPWPRMHLASDKRSIARLTRIVLMSVISLNMSMAAADNDTSPDPLTIDAAVKITVRDNPSLAQMQERYKALSVVPAQVGALPDPMVNFNAMSLPTDTFNLDQEAMTQLQIGFSQMIPFPGKLSLKEEAAEFDASAAGESVDEVRLHLIGNVRNQWWQVYYLDHALATVQSNQQLFREFIQVTQTKYQTGTGLQQDVLLAQLELSRLLDQEIRIQAMRRNQVIRLNVLMDRPTNEVVHLAQIAAPKISTLSAEEVYFAMAETSRPLLKQKSIEIDAAKSRLSLAEKNRYPDFAVGIAYGNRDGNNPPPRNDARSSFLSVMLGVKIPLYAKRKQQKAIDQRATELQKSVYASQDSKTAVYGAISKAVTDYDRAREEFELFDKGIIPQASQTVASMLAGYQVNEVDFLNLVRAQVTLLNYQLEYWKSLTEAKQSLARLEAAVGEETIYE